MNRVCNTIVGGIALGALLLSLVPAAVTAQRRRPQEPPPPPWTPVSLGARFGYDQNANGEVIGVQAHVPVTRGGTFELMPSADITFLNQLKDYEFNLEAVYVTRGRRGGIYVGGGLAWRNSVFGVDPSSPRETLQGFSAVGGIRSGMDGLFGTQLELRWIFLSDAAFNPRLISLGVNFPLWGGGDRDRGRS